MDTSLTPSEAARLGITEDHLRGPGFISLFHGVHARAGQPLRLEDWVAAARKVLPEQAAVTGVTALRLRGLPVGRDFPLWFWPPRIRRPGIRAVGGPRPAGATATVAEAYRVITEELDLLACTEIGDALLHRRFATQAELCAISPQVATFLQPGAESVRETRLRLLLVLAGLPTPLCNHEIRDAGVLVGRVDLLYPRERVVIEYEGAHHRTEDDQWVRDIDRYERLHALGYHVVRVTAARMARPVDLVQDVHAVLRDRGLRDCHPVLDARWRSLFGAPADRMLA